MTNLREARVFGFFLLSVLVLFLSIIYMTFATTIGSSVTVDSALTVSGATTLNGSSTFGDAAADVNLFTGTLQASTTALFTSGITTYGNSTFGDAATDVNLFTGTLQASTTALFTSGFTTYGNWSINKSSETAVSFGTAGINFDSNTLVIDPSNNRVGVGSSTPITELGVQGAATTTISIGSTGSNAGGCIQLKGTNGINFRIYATASTSNTKQLHVEEGACQ